MPPRRQSHESVEDHAYVKMQYLMIIVTTKVLILMNSNDTMNHELGKIRANIIRHDNELEVQKSRKAKLI